MAAASADFVKAIVALKEGEVAAANKEREKKERDRLAAADEFFLFAVDGPLSSKFIRDLPSEPSTRYAALLREIHHSLYEVDGHYMTTYSVMRGGTRYYTSHVTRVPLQGCVSWQTRSSYLPNLRPVMHRAMVFS